MLVLSRFPGESIKIGKDITVTFVRRIGDKVRLGFEAPPEVLILREEVPDTGKLGLQAAEAECRHGLQSLKDLAAAIQVTPGMQVEGASTLYHLERAAAGLRLALKQQGDAA